MRTLVLLPLLLTALVSGCLDDNSTPPAGEAADDLDSSDPAFVTRTGTTELGSANGVSLTPARYDFTVVVPAGGATEVRWQMTVEGVANNNLGNSVEGPGCNGGVGNINVVIAVVGSSTFGGSCADLAEGEHAFTAVIGTPTLSFTAKVTGLATVVVAVDG